MCSLLGIEEIINLRNIEGYTALQISKDDTCGAILQKATPIEAVQEEEDSD